METNKLGIVLSAGGSRAAYQVGVLRYFAENCKEFSPKIFTGVSAGSINACYMSHGESPEHSTSNMYTLWEQLQFKDVMRSNFNSILGVGRRFLHDLFLSKFTRRVLLRSILDASPLAHTLLSHIRFWKISKAIRSGIVQGLAISATNYQTGGITIFYDSTEPIVPWHRQKRSSVRTSIRIRHIMASCSIPLLFEPVRIGNYFYGDGALRLNYPLSPAIHLGATKILAIGVRGPQSDPPPDENLKHLSMGFVAGSVLNSIFLEQLETDYENLCRLNEAIVPRSVLRKIDVIMVRPSKDLGEIAKNFIDDVPFHLRQLLKTSAVNSAELGDLLSYLMFSPGYIKTLLELGMQDAQRQIAKLQNFLASDVTNQSQSK